MRNIAVLLPLLLVAILAPQFAVAHGQATSIQRTVGDHVIELEYSEQGNPVAGEFVSYTFSILNKKTEAFETFKSMFVRFSTDKRTIANATLSPDEFNPHIARMGVNFPSAGSYTVEARFYDEKEEMANASFEITAEEPEQPNGRFYGFALIESLVIFCAGLLVGFFAQRLRPIASGKQ